MRGLVDRVKRQLPGLGLGCGSCTWTSAFPYISGDSFRLACDIAWTPQGTVNDLLCLGGEGVVYVNQHLLPDLVDACRRTASSDFVGQLVVHGGDDELSEYNAEQLGKFFARIWASSLNPAREDDSLKWIPIGIENLQYGRSGCPQWFDAERRTRFLNMEAMSRKRHLIFGSFRSSTNPSVRKPLSAAIVARGGFWLEPRQRLLTRYFATLSESVFVISPPGNGLDCHRTWEALYTGAIPVVLKGTLPTSVTRQLPIWEVEVFSDFLDCSDDELLDTAQGLGQRPMDLAFLPSWIARIFRVN